MNKNSASFTVRMKRVSIILGSAFLLCSALFMVIGWVALVPAFIVLGLAVMTQKVLESLIVGCSVGFFLIPMYGDPDIAAEVFSFGEEKGLGFPMNMLAAFEDTIARDGHNYGLIWIILVCMLYGSLVQLLVSSGGINKLVETSGKYVKSKRDALSMSFILSIMFFIDDYLNVLTVGNTMRPITDKFNIAREKLAMILSLISTPITIIVPISTWTIFYGSQLMTIDSVSAVHSNPISAFSNTIVYNYAAWVSLAVALIVIWDKIPLMKDMGLSNETKGLSQSYVEIQSDQEPNKNKGKLWYFYIPLSLLMIFTVFPYPMDWTDDILTLEGFTSNIDALRGVATALVITYFLYLFSGAMTFDRISHHFIKGLESMTFVLVLLGFAYMLKEVQDVLGFNALVESKLGDMLNPQLLPVLVFIMVAVVSWASGATWGIYAILIPVTALLSQQSGADFWLVQGALASGTVWGNAACFFSDNRVLVAQATKTNMIIHSMTQMPTQIVVLITTTVLYLLAGYFI